MALIDTVIVVAGVTRPLPFGGKIADAIFNGNDSSLYLTNPALGRVEIFQVANTTFVAAGACALAISVVLAWTVRWAWRRPEPDATRLRSAVAAGTPTVGACQTTAAPSPIAPACCRRARRRDLQTRHRGPG